MKLLLLILIAAYFILRLPNLTLQPIFADEAIYIRWAQVMKSEPTLRFLPMSDGKTPLFMWLMTPLFKFIHDPLFAGRFLSVISGFLTLLGVFFLSKKVFNSKVAFWASFFYVITPYTIFFDRMALVDSMLSAFTIWIVYFAIWLAVNLRLDLAMILGYLMGGAILTKTPALVNLLILPISLLGFKKSRGRYSWLRVLILLSIAILIALVIYNLLRLGPNFQLLSSRNADYVFSPLELVGRPLDPFIPHLRDIADWFPRLFTWPILAMVGVGIFYVIAKPDRLGLIILLWAIVPILISMTFLKTYTARYLLPSIPLLLIVAGFGLQKVLDKPWDFFPSENKVKCQSLSKSLASILVFLPMTLIFNYQLLTNPPPTALPKEERKGYFEEWTAGYGFKEIAQFLIEEGKEQKVLVATEGFFGTLPDGLFIYLDKSNISVVGSRSTISDEIRGATKDNLVFFVGNKKNIGGLSKVKVIKEFPKSKSQNGNFQDAMVLYQVLP